MQLPEHGVPVLYRQVGPDVRSGDVGVQLQGCSWHWHLLHLECGVVLQLLQFSVADLVCSNSGIVERGRRHSADDAGECVSWGVVTAFDVAYVCGELGDVLDVSQLAWGVG